MSHFLLGVPIEMTELLVNEGETVIPITKPELGFRFEIDKSRAFGLFVRDSEKAAEAFMAIKTYEDALGVFSVYGAFMDWPLRGPNVVSFDEVQNVVRAAWKVRTATLNEIKSWHKQRWFVYANTPVPPEFADVWPGIMTLTNVPASLWISLADPPRLEFIPPDNILEALINLLHLEKLQGIRHRYCALPDCRKPFQLKGDIDRKFCSYDCGHKSAVRASRQRAKEAKAEESSKRSTKGR